MNNMKKEKITDEEIMNVKNIHLQDRVYSMKEIISKFGIKQKGKYYNNIEKKDDDIKHPFKVVRRYSSNFVVLDNEIEIKHVPYQIWKQIKVDIVFKKEKINGYKLV